MIITTTPSPAIDWTIATDSFGLGLVNRATTVSREASGKGLNVSWALHKQGLETLAVFPAGGQTSDFMKETLGAASLPHLVVPVGAEVRTNITLRVSGSPDTKINTSSDLLTTAEIGTYLGVISSKLQNARVLVSSGSLPPGAPDTLHRDIIALGKKAGVFTVVDSSGHALVEALTQGPDLVKPNQEELEELTGRTVMTLGDVVAACEEVRAMGAGAVLASLGRQGVVLVDSEGVLVGSVTGVVARNTIGAGDALLAGFIATPDDRVAQVTTALVWASSAVQSESTLFDVDRTIEDNVSVSATWDAHRVLGNEVPETTAV
jgi:1-phosphofructokinase